MVDIITKVNETYRNETIPLNGHAFVGCRFEDCTLYLIDTDNEVEGILRLINCNFVSPDLKGDGWPYEVVELFKLGKPFSWEGPLGNHTVTKH